MINGEKRLMFDVICKYIILFAITLGLLKIVFHSVGQGEEVNLPDWVVTLYTMTWVYFFRKSPKKE